MDTKSPSTKTEKSFNLPKGSTLIYYVEKKRVVAIVYKIMDDEREFLEYGAAIYRYPMVIDDWGNPIDPADKYPTCPHRDTEEKLPIREIKNLIRATALFCFQKHPVSVFIPDHIRKKPKGHVYTKNESLSERKRWKKFVRSNLGKFGARWRNGIPDKIFSKDSKVSKADVYHHVKYVYHGKEVYKVQHGETKFMSHETNLYPLTLTASFNEEAYTMEATGIHFYAESDLRCRFVVAGETMYSKATLRWDGSLTCRVPDSFDLESVSGSVTFQVVTGDGHAQGAPLYLSEGDHEESHKEEHHEESHKEDSHKEESHKVSNQIDDETDDEMPALE